MNRSRRVAVVITIAAAALLPATSATAAPGTVTPSGGGVPAPSAGESTPPPAAADVQVVQEPAVPRAAGRGTAVERAQLASVSTALTTIPGFDPAHLAQILKNLGQGTL